MDKSDKRSNFNKRLITSKPIFVLAILLFVLITVAVWLSGVSIHRSLFKNAIITTSILSGISFIFFSFALFQGFKLKDNLGTITSKTNWDIFSGMPDIGFGKGFHLSGDSFFEVIGAIIIGILSILFLLLILWLFGSLVWVFIVFIIAALYWIFFRAIRFVLRHGRHCKGNFFRSVGYGFAYTVLYSFTFYLLLLIPYFMGRY